MDDDQLTKKEETETPAESSTVEQTPEEQPQTGAEPENQPEAEEPTEEAPKKGAEARIKELNAKAKAEAARADSLEQKVNELLGSIQTPVDITQTPQQPTFTPIIGPDEELTRDQLNQRLAEQEQETLKKADSIAQIRSRQAQAITDIRQGILEAVRSYKQLDPESDEFNKELSDTITEAVQDHIKTNPTDNFKKFVDRQMRSHQQTVEKEVAKQSETIAKQASETALRPKSVKPVEKKFEELTTEEMEKKLGVVY